MKQSVRAKKAKKGGGTERKTKSAAPVKKEAPKEPVNGTGNSKSIGVGNKLKKKKSDTKQKNSTSSIKTTKYKYKVGEEIECVNTFKVVKIVRKCTKNVDEDFYDVQNLDQNEISRLKTSYLELGNLKKEAVILKKVAKQPGDSHFLQVLDFGSSADTLSEFLIVSPFGLNMIELKKKVLKADLTLECGMNFALQSLQAIKVLHTCGFIHRNIKPGSFYVGVGDTAATIYLQEFRFHRKYLENNKHMAEKMKAKRIGSVRYCSRNGHNDKDQSRRDDLESWLYTIFFLMDASSIVWAKETDHKKVLKQKEEFMKNDSSSQFSKVSSDFKAIISGINGILFNATPDYEFIQSTIQNIQRDNKMDATCCDWKGKDGIDKTMEGETAMSPDQRFSGELDVNIDMSKRKKKPKKKATRKKFGAGDMIKSEGSNGWKVINLLGSGGFGDVYKVSREGTPGEYALKTESEEGEKRYLRLKIEVTVMMKTSPKVKSKEFEHFIEFIDRGKCEELKCKFVVMGLVGPSLEDIRKKYLLCNYSKNTCFNVAIQTVAAVRDLHKIGYIHRDIKPANYAIGLKEFESTVYMLDFGIARLFLDTEGKHKIPRKKVKFLGTLRYSSRACMKQVDQGRKDDLECWLFMIMDLIDDLYGMPWKRENEAKEILKQKEGFFVGEFPDVYKKLPKSMSVLASYINNLEYESEPDYEYIMEFLKTCAKDHGIKPDKKLDWIGKLKKKAFESESEKSDKKTGGSDEEKE